MGSWAHGLSKLTTSRVDELKALTKAFQGLKCKKKANRLKMVKGQKRDSSGSQGGVKGSHHGCISLNAFFTIKNAFIF
jgi:hypothetical protein